MTNLGKPPVKDRITLDKAGVASVQKKKKTQKAVIGVTKSAGIVSKQNRCVSASCPYGTWCVSGGSRGTS